MNIPRGAQALIDLRKAGKVPDCPVVVSFVGDPGLFDAVHIYPRPGTRYDWGFMAGLEAYVMVRSNTDAEDCIKALHELRKEWNAPYVLVCDVDRQQVAFVVQLNPPDMMHCTHSSEWWLQFFEGTT